MNNLMKQEKHIKNTKSRKTDRDEEIQKPIDKNLDLRDRWAGIRNFKKSNINQCHIIKT